MTVSELPPEALAKLDELIAAIGLTADDANRIDNAGYVHVNGYVPDASVAALARPKRPAKRTFSVAQFRDTDGRQARDEDGKWTLMGGPARRAAKKLRARAEAPDATITAEIRSVVEANGGSMKGLVHRLKGIDSLTRKIGDKAKARGITIDQSAAAIIDALRYTAVVSEDSYTNTVRQLEAQLSAAGYVPYDVENHWTRGDAYNGLHMSVRSPSGLVSELQVHTAASLAAKNKIHRAYETYRDPKTPEVVARQLFNDMVAISDQAPQPKDVLTVDKLVFRPHIRRDFAVERTFSVAQFRDTDGTQPRDDHGMWSDVGGSNKPGLIRSALIRRRGPEIKGDKIEEGMILDGWDATGEAADHGLSAVKGPHKVLSIQTIVHEDRWGKTRSKHTVYLLDVENIKTGEVLKRVSVEADEELTQIPPKKGDKGYVGAPAANPGIDMMAKAQADVAEAKARAKAGHDEHTEETRQRAKAMVDAVNADLAAWAKERAARLKRERAAQIAAAAKLKPKPRAVVHVNTRSVRDMTTGRFVARAATVDTDREVSNGVP